MMTLWHVNAWYFAKTCNAKQHVVHLILHPPKHLMNQETYGITPHIVPTKIGGSHDLLIAQVIISCIPFFKVEMITIYIINKHNLPKKIIIIFNCN
jgi:hypothetical protein